MKLLPLVLILSLALAPRESVTADCDSTTIAFPASPSDLSGPTFTYSGTTDSATVKWYSDLVGFDFRQGRLFGYVACSAFVVQGWETYRIDGAGSWATTSDGGIPITITLAAEMEAPHNYNPSICKYCPGFVFSLQASSGERDSIAFFGVSDVQHVTARIDLSPLAGEEFKVRYRLYGEAYFCPAQGSADVQIGFTGIPPGATLVSVCRGGEPAVPTRRRTWGSVKATYR